MLVNTFDIIIQIMILLQQIIQQIHTFIFYSPDKKVCPYSHNKHYEYHGAFPSDRLTSGKAKNT